jgi:hypothetical protein
LALFAAGVLDVAAGPDPTIEADAKTSRFVIRSRFEQHPGGVEIDRQNRLLTKSGTPICNTWVVGSPVEGPNFFTYVLPLPGINSRPVLDADRCVLGLFRSLSEKCRQSSALSDHSNHEIVAV